MQTPEIVHLADEPAEMVPTPYEVGLAANVLALRSLAQHVATHHGIAFDDAMAVASNLSPNLWGNLASVEGCAVLAIVIAGLLGLDPFTNPLLFRAD